MLKGRIMCLDLGQRRTGVAVSDMLGYTAQPVGIIESKGLQQDIEKIKQLIKEKEVFRLVIGYPLNLDGSEGAKAKAVREQYEKIKESVDCETVLFDERLSTKQAERMLDMENVGWKKRKNVVDVMAAQIILQNYLNVTDLN